MIVERIILLAICITLASAKGLSQFRIYSGSDAIEGEFPYQASFRPKTVNNNYEHTCGAAIINHRFLLTAAHCCYFGFKGVGDAIVVVGALHRSGDGISMDIDKITPHKDHDQDTNLNDIALIRTVKNIIFSNELQPIALPIEYNVADDRKMIISGWGEIGPDIDPFVLQYVEVPTLTLEECRNIYNDSPTYIYDSSICTLGKYNANPCVGDSG